MTSNLDLQATLAGSPLDHAPGVDPVHSLSVKLAATTAGGAEEGAFVVTGRPAWRRRRDDGADAGEGVGHDADQGAVAQADEGRGVDALDQHAGLVDREHGGLAALDDVLGAAHRGGGIGGEDSAGDKPIEKHADGGEVLLDGRLRGWLTAPPADNATVRASRKKPKVRRSVSELVVQANAEDIAAELSRGAHESRAPSGVTGCCEVNLGQGKVGGRAAKVVTEIFGLCTPIGSKHPFEAGAGRPASAGTRDAAGARDGRI
jgi:hypothetical protein